jgi:lipopolysaccharide export system permease protein
LFFIGAPLGAIIRKGGLGLPLVLSALIFVLYYILSVTGEKFVREDVWVPVFGMWLSSIVLMPFGVWVTIKTNKDSSLMDIDSWKKFFTNIFEFISNKIRKK